MALSRKEREQLALAIEQENVMLKRVKRVIRTEIILFALFVVFFVWGWYDRNDKMLPHVSDGALDVIKWIGTIGGAVMGIILILSFISYSNGRKSLLAKINLYDEGKGKK
ncbi:hypothetical protein [Catenisphaera adipataccumulans]|jgi:hypothetical protein|uniref:Uncharacterized protein n=1 Tax=Catenisphaera adipataccumulans TaxID=700500 RepID=A0A7W8FXX8_9FIRM|nr:hypothetical protein [Catenisphaera adipataccumulans]MBB5183427.1 hypothetical protein [Catenisphaera adipataccumulans]